jgi:hypothetical protein
MWVCSCRPSHTRRPSRGYRSSSISPRHTVVRHAGSHRPTRHEASSYPRSQSPTVIGSPQVVHVTHGSPPPTVVRGPSHRIPRSPTTESDPRAGRGHHGVPHTHSHEYAHHVPRSRTSSPAVPIRSPSRVSYRGPRSPTVVSVPVGEEPEHIRTHEPQVVTVPSGRSRSRTTRPGW